MLCFHKVSLLSREFALFPCYSWFITCYFSFVTRYILLITDHSSLAIPLFSFVEAFFLLVTLYLLLVTRFFLLVTIKFWYFQSYHVVSLLLSYKLHHFLKLNFQIFGRTIFSELKNMARRPGKK